MSGRLAGCLRKKREPLSLTLPQVPVYKLDQLAPGHALPGPTILIDQISTVVVEPGCTAHITVDGNVRIDVHGAPLAVPSPLEGIPRGSAFVAP